MGKKKPSIDVSKYLMSIHLGVCHGPVDEIKSIYVGEREAWSGNVATEQSILISNPELFGGIRKEGGVEGIAYYLPGGDTQILPANLCNRLGLTQATTPGYRGVTSLFFVGDLVSRLGFYWTANQPTLKGVWARVTRYSTSLSTTYSQIGLDANPAHIIHEALTNRVWGMGADPSGISQASFEYAAEYLFNEGFGMSLMWAQQTSVEDFITEVIDHIQATVYQDPRTGLFSIKLIRDDYNPLTLPIFNADNCTVDSYQKKSWGETINEIVVTWTNPENEQEETVSLQDLANFSIQGAIVSDSRNYYGVRNANFAKELCARDLRVASAPLASVEISANRDAWDLVPGEVIELQYPEYGIESMVVRIVTLDYGSDGDASIRITGVEDIFSLPFTEYSDPPSTAWQDPSEDPLPMAYVHLMTLPYFFVASNLDAAQLSSFAYPEAYVAILAAQNGGDTFTFDLLGREFDNLGNPITTSLGLRNCVGRGLTPSILSRSEFSTVGSFAGLRGPLFPQANIFVIVPGASEALSEIMLITAYDGINYTLQRGVLDTVPRAWPAGTQVFFIETQSDIVDTTTYSAFETVIYKLLSVTSKGILPEVSAPLEPLVVSERPHLPLRPANCAVQGSKYANVTVPPSTDLQLTWSNRNRLTENAIVMSWEQGNISPEAGQLTRVTIFSSSMAQLYQADFAGVSATVPFASFAPATSLIVRFRSVSAGFLSLQSYDIGVTIL